MHSFFANPWVLWLLPLLPLLALVLAIGRRRRTRALSLLGGPAVVRNLATVHPGQRTLWTLSLFAGLTLLIVACAGPQWGETAVETASGRDVVVVLDLSRSMLAEQPSRQERARRALLDLCDALQKRGGHRLALVVFAGKPKLVFPLTHDYDHFRAALVQQDADNLPPELRPVAEEALSGTRIGAALRLAVEAHDPRFQGAQDILLVSDGDDPAEDGEWADGAELARRQGIPVYTIGVGDPQQESPIPVGEGFLQHADKVVTTRLREGPLQEIAERSRGLYFPAHTSAFALGRLYRDVIEHAVRRQESEPSAAGLILYQPRYLRFFAAAFVLLGLTLLLGEARKRPAGRPLGSWWVLPLALLGLSAGPASEVADFLRQGNAAFARGAYEEALRHYDLAAERTLDPGLIAFNRAAAYYRLERYREAEQDYRRCLEDHEAPPLRRARALYDLGNCLVQQAQGSQAALLEQAVNAYEQSLSHLSADDDSLRPAALHNLELAKLLWLKARAANPSKPPPPNGASPKQKEPVKKNGSDAKTQAGNPSHIDKTKVKPVLDKIPNGQKPIEMKEKVPGKGNLPLIPDKEQLQPLSPEDTAAYLEQIADRILRERRDYRRQAASVAAGVKDW